MKRGGHMNKEWSLKKLYQGYDDPAFTADEKALDEAIAAFTAFCADLQGDAKEVLKKGIGLTAEIERLGTLLFSFTGT